MDAQSHKSSILEEVLGTKSKVAVLRNLFQSPIGHSGSAIARKAGVALFAVQRALAALESIGLVEVERGAGENRYRLNSRHYLVENGLRALFDGERQMPQTLARELRKLLSGRVISAGLFGSFARGTARAGSDIDLFVVVGTVREKEGVSRILADAQTTVTARFGWPLQPVIFERQRLAQGIKKGQTLLQEAARDWRPVAGLSPRELLKLLNEKPAIRQHP
jgi:predicted nucleotidyltransferase